MATYSQQKTFSTKSLAAIPSIGLASMLLQTGSIAIPPSAVAQLSFPCSAFYHDLLQAPEGNDGYIVDYINEGSITTFSEKVYYAAPIGSKKAGGSCNDAAIDFAINAVKALSFLEADEEADRAIDLFMLEQPRKKTKKIYIAKRNK